MVVLSSSLQDSGNKSEEGKGDDDESEQEDRKN